MLAAGLKDEGNTGRVELIVSAVARRVARILKKTWRSIALSSRSGSERSAAGWNSRTGERPFRIMVLPPFA
jgi:hypothetical protein